MASGKEKITADDIRKAETSYSESRMKALYDEWNTEYKNILRLIHILKKSPANFKLSDSIVLSKLKVSIEDFMTHREVEKDSILANLSGKWNEENPYNCIVTALEYLFKFGIIGIRNENFRGIHWSFKKEKFILSEIHEGTVYYIHPCVWSTLGITPVKLKQL